MAELEQIAHAGTGNLGTLLCASNLTRECGRFEARDRVFSEGDSGGAVYVVRSGRLELLLAVTVDDVVRIRLAGPGEVVGLASAMNKAPYCKSAVALEETILDKFDAHDVLSFLVMHPECHVEALAFLCADADAVQRILVRAKSSERAHHTHRHTEWSKS